MILFTLFLYKLTTYEYIINTDYYMNIASFARHVNKTTIWINTLINRGNIKYILISGIKFIKYKEYENRFGKGESVKNG